MRNQTGKQYSRHLLALLLAFMLIAAACGSDDAGRGRTSTETTEGAAATTTTAAAQTTTEATVPAEDSAVTEVQHRLAAGTTDVGSHGQPGRRNSPGLLYNVYETLVRLQPDGSITGLLAESWDDQR